ncbi:MAG: FapA family protein, partial [bacterium]
MAESKKINEKDENTSNEHNPIDINTSRDGTAAFLTLIPHNKDFKSITIQDINSELKRQNIVFGIKEKEINAALARYESTKSFVTKVLIASGKPPTPGCPGKIKLKAKPISDLVVLNKIKSIQWKEEQYTIGDNIEPVNDKKEFMAAKTGILSFVQNHLEIIPVNFDSITTIDISENKMSASVTIIPAGQGGKDCNEEYITKLIKENNISYGILENAVREAVKKAGVKREKVENLLIAQGKPEANGKDSTMEYYFNVKTSLTPQANEDGGVDFKNVNLIANVKQNQELARRIPPTNGSPGTNIFGDSLPATDGENLPMPIGPNTRISPDDHDLLLASVSGNASLNNNMVEVSEGYVINGNVDYSTGNINYPKAVIVKKDLMAGFSITSGGDVEIGGIIENSTLT